MDALGLAYATAMLVSFIDMLGQSFLVPVIVPYGKVLGASDSQIAFFATVQGFGSLLSTLWLPVLADSTNRRTAVLISIAGSACAYMVQSMAYDLEEGVLVFTVGKAIAGFFAGTAPVLRAFISDLYADDPKNMLQKLVVFQVATEGVGLAMAPIAGSIALLSIQLPFDCAAGGGVFGLLWAFFFFPKDTRNLGKVPVAATPAGKAAGQSKNKAEEAAEAAKVKEGSPFTDWVVLLLGSAFIILAMLVIGLQFLLPDMLFKKDAYGIVGETVEAKAGEVSRITGLLNLPQGIANIFVIIFCYQPIVLRLGETKTILLAGVVGGSTFAVYGFTTQVWQLAVLQVVFGSVFGLIFPAVGPLMAKYSQAFLPNHKAQAQAIPNMGFAIGMMVGQNIVAWLLASFSLNITWFFMGALMCAAASVMAFVAFVVNSKVAQKNNEDRLTSDQREIFAGSERGETPEVFVALAAQKVSEYLQAHSTELWNAPIQGLVLQRLLTTIPEMRDWGEQDHGLKYMEDLYHIMETYPEELEAHLDLFPEQTKKKFQYSDHYSAFGGLHALRHDQVTAPALRMNSKSGSQLLG